LQAACSQGGDRKSGTCATVFAAKKPKPLSLRTRWLAMKTSALKIVGIGEVLWDLLPGGKQLGGAPANFAYMSNLLGDHGIVASRIGSDPLGREMAEAMQQLGLTTSYLQTDETHSTGTVGVKVDPTGQPEFTITPSVAWDFLDWTPLWEELAGQADVVCFGTLAQRSPNSRVTIRRFLQAVRTDTLRVFDVNLRQTFFSAEVLSESLKYSDVVKLNDLELPLVCNLLSLEFGEQQSSARRLLQKYGLKLVCVTRGAHGSLLVSPSSAAAHPGFRVNVVDTVGAGDAFTACLEHHYIRGASLKTINEPAIDLPHG